MNTDRFELRQIDGAPADQRVIGIVGDNETVVAGVPFGTEGEKSRAEMLVAAPEMLAALRLVNDIAGTPDELESNGHHDMAVAMRVVRAAILNAGGWL